VAPGNWTGSANALSNAHVDWEIIDSVSAACAKPATQSTHRTSEEHRPAPLLPARRAPVTAERIIRQRRSAVAMDGQTRISAEQFFLMLDRLLPRYDRPPFSALGPPSCVHLALFVHLVDDLDPGLYCLCRSEDRLGDLQGAMDPSFTWEKPDGCPESLPLFVLKRGDARRVAWRLSCDQQIAGASAFSLGMLAEFGPRLHEHGPWFYRRLFWETGMIGQVLYLEAEAAGVRSTGIGCFFDDPVHEMFGLSDNTFQSLYHFTVGGAVDDARLTTLPPYPDR
ncbi:MAG: SagB/ThcOx family dehydrogenase, partial [Phycisphaerae bacterium]